MDMIVGLLGHLVAVTLVVAALLVVLGRQDVGAGLFWRSLAVSVLVSLVLSMAFTFIGICGR